MTSLCCNHRATYSYVCLHILLGDPGYPGPPGLTGLRGEIGQKGNLY